MSECLWGAIDEDSEGCDKPATHWNCDCAHADGSPNVCEKHKCRCTIYGGGHKEPDWKFRVLAAEKLWPEIRAVLGRANPDEWCDQIRYLERRALDAEKRAEEAKSQAVNERLRRENEHMIHENERGRIESETVARIVASLVGLSDQYFEGDMVEQCDFTAEGIGVAAEWIKDGRWKEKGE